MEMAIGSYVVRPPGFEPGLTADSFSWEWEAAVIDQAARQHTADSRIAGSGPRPHVAGPETGQFVSLSSHLIHKVRSLRRLQRQSLPLPYRFHDVLQE